MIQRTPARKNTSTPLFETLFYFDNLHVAEGELASCAVQIAAFDRGRFGPHMLIGSIDLDLEGIYQLPNHELWKTWLTLTDPKGKRDGPQGQVLACITVLGKEDQPADHTQDLARSHFPLPPGHARGQHRPPWQRTPRPLLSAPAPVPPVRRVRPPGDGAAGV